MTGNETTPEYLWQSPGSHLLTPSDIGALAKATKESRSQDLKDMSHTMLMLTSWLRCALHDCASCHCVPTDCPGDEYLQEAREWLR